MIKKRNIQRSFLIGYTNSIEKLPLSPLRKIFCIMKTKLLKAEPKMYLFTNIQGYFELKTPSSNALLHNITELSQTLKEMLKRSHRQY